MQKVYRLVPIYNLVVHYFHNLIDMIKCHIISSEKTVYY